MYEKDKNVVTKDIRGEKDKNTNTFRVKEKNKEDNRKKEDVYKYLEKEAQQDPWTKELMEMKKYIDAEFEARKVAKKLDFSKVDEKAKNVSTKNQKAKREKPKNSNSKKQKGG